MIEPNRRTLKYIGSNIKGYVDKSIENKYNAYKIEKQEELISKIIKKRNINC